MPEDFAREVFEMHKEVNPQIDNAVSTLTDIESDEQALRDCQYREKIARDRATLLYESEQRGFQKGYRRMQLTIATTMLQHKRPIEDIALFTEMPLDEVLQLQQEQQNLGVL